MPFPVFKSLQLVQYVILVSVLGKYHHRFNDGKGVGGTEPLFYPSIYVTKSIQVAIWLIDNRPIL